MEWPESPQEKCIFWLNGMAGTGKSTIARTVARLFSERRQLGASFFFRRGEGDRGNAAKLFPTTIKQLAYSIPWLKPYVKSAVSNEPDIGGKSFKDQLDRLLLQPLNLKQPDQKIAKKVVVIDGLDECDKEEDIRLIIQLLPQLWKMSSHLYICSSS